MIGMFGLVTGCSGSGGGKPLALEEVHQKLQQMQSYETEAKITFFSNKGSNTYVVLQQAKASGPYRMEILEPENNKGILTISDGTKVVQVDPSIGGKIEAQDTPVRDALLLYPFLQNYLQSEASASSVGSNHGVRWSHRGIVGDRGGKLPNAARDRVARRPSEASSSKALGRRLHGGARSRWRSRTKVEIHPLSFSTRIFR